MNSHTDRKLDLLCECRDDGQCEHNVIRCSLTDDPEKYCHRCGGPNVPWTAPSPLWNEVMRFGEINGADMYCGIVCPTCFAVLAEQVGIAQGWQLTARLVQVELKTVTPSGRTWNESTWLWEESIDG